MYQKLLICFTFVLITQQNIDDMPQHSHKDALEKLLENHKDSEYDWEEASMLFFEAYTSISRDMLQEMMSKEFEKGDQGYFEQLVMVKSYEGIKDYFQQHDGQKFNKAFMRKVISGDEILHFIMPYLSEAYKGLSEQGVDFGNLEDL